MKKLLKILAVPAIVALGLLSGCNNGDISLDLAVTVSTDTPSLDDPKNLEYGVLLTWGVTQDGGVFTVTRRAKDGEEITLGSKIRENRFFDRITYSNILVQGGEYTYRVYNSADNATYFEADNGGVSISGGKNYTDSYVTKNSYAEKKITLSALKAEGEKLPASLEADVRCSFKNDNLSITFLNNESQVASCKKIVIKNAETGETIKTDSACSSMYGFPCKEDKITVEIVNVWLDDYYADSDPLVIKDIENKKENVTIENLQSSLRGTSVVLLWTTSGKEKGEPGEFTIIRKEKNLEGAEYKKLAITPTYEEKYDGSHYWKAVDATIELGKSYEYRVFTDSNSKSTEVSRSDDPSISIVNVYYSNNAVTLKWEAQNIAEFVIYRADGDLSNDGQGEDKYYDLFAPINALVTPVTTEDGEIYYTAKDASVEPNKFYTYRITSKSDTSKVVSTNNLCVNTIGSVTGE